MRPADALMVRWMMIVVLSAFSIVTAGASEIGEAGIDSVSRTMSPRGEHPYSRMSFSATDSTRIHPYRLAAMSAVTAGYIGGIYVKLKNTWWSDQTRPFHAVTDFDYARNIDKMGHFYGGIVHADLIATGLRWSGVRPGPSLLYGAGLSGIFYVAVELKDGFSPRWGFDVADLGTSLAGAAYPYLQYSFPALQDFSFKWSYIPTTESKYLKKNGGRAWVFSDDYEGQTFWLSVNARRFMPASVRRYWPKFLNLAAGAAAENLAEKSRGNLVLLVAPDIDFEKLIPGDGDFALTVKRALNLVHPPLPAVRVSPNVVWYGLYFNTTH